MGSRKTWHVTDIKTGVRAPFDHCCITSHDVLNASSSLDVAQSADSPYLQVRPYIAILPQHQRTVTCSCFSGPIVCNEKTAQAPQKPLGGRVFSGHAPQPDRGLLRVWPSRLIGFGAVIAGPENTDFGAGHLFSLRPQV